MSEERPSSKVVEITECKLSQIILDRLYWQQLENAMGWRLLSFVGRRNAEFFCAEIQPGVWDSLHVITGPARDSLLAKHPERPPLPLAPVLTFPDTTES